MNTGESTQKSVLITGATDGLGKALALLLAERGYTVFAAGRSTEKLAQLDAVARAKKLPLKTVGSAKSGRQLVGRETGLL